METCTKIRLLSNLVSCRTCPSENLHQPVTKAQSHNDYKQSIPFLQAYYAGTGSIEADVYLLNGKLYVAHERKEVSEDCTLTDLYLKPLFNLFRKNSNHLYPDSSQHLQLVIDIKEDHEHVIPELLKNCSLTCKCLTFQSI